MLRFCLVLFCVFLFQLPADSLSASHITITAPPENSEFRFKTELGWFIIEAEHYNNLGECYIGFKETSNSGEWQVRIADRQYEITTDVAKISGLIREADARSAKGSYPDSFKKQDFSFIEVKQVNTKKVSVLLVLHKGHPHSIRWGHVASDPDAQGMVKYCYIKSRGPELPKLSRVD